MVERAEAVYFVCLHSNWFATHDSWRRYGSLVLWLVIEMVIY